MTRPVYFTAALLAVLVLAPLAPSGVHAQISVRSSLSDDREVEPGTVYEGTIQVKNETGVPQQAKVYQTDYLFYHDGSNVFGTPGSMPRSNAGWIQFSPVVLTLPPHAAVPVHYVVTVPEAVGDRPSEGSYWSMLMVEAIAPESPESTLSEEEPQYKVRQVTRYGVQIASHVRGTGTRTVAFAGSTLVREEDGSAVLRLNLENTGSLMVHPDVWLELYDASGVSRGRRPGAKTRVYPGTSVQQRIVIGELPAGAYKALVVVDTGGDDVFGAEYTLHIQ